MEEKVKQAIVSIDGKKRFNIEDNLRRQFTLALIEGMNFISSGKSPDEVLFYCEKRAKKTFREIYTELLKE